MHRILFVHGGFGSRIGLLLIEGHSRILFIRLQTNFGDLQVLSAELSVIEVAERQLILGNAYNCVIMERAAIFY